MPQMINFEVLGGVDFKKGCYPGQEIVARSQYLGKLKRRMRSGACDARRSAVGGLGHRPFVRRTADRHGVSCRRVRLAAGADLLFEAPIDRLETGHAALCGDVERRDAAIRPLPYELFDPDSMSQASENWYVYYPAPRAGPRGACSGALLQRDCRQCGSGTAGGARRTWTTPTWMEVYEGIRRSRRFQLALAAAVRDEPDCRRNWRQRAASNDFECCDGVSKTWVCRKI